MMNIANIHGLILEVQLKSVIQTKMSGNIIGDIRIIKFTICYVSTLSYYATGFYLKYFSLYY